MSSRLTTETKTAVVPEYNFDESVGYWMVLASQAYQKSLNDELAPHGITFRQCQVLGWLVHDGELSQVDLASRMMIEPATLVDILDRMERDKLVCRTSATTDRRRKLICISPQAQDVWSNVVRCARRVRTRAVEGLTPRQVSMLKRILQKVLGNLS